MCRRGLAKHDERKIAMTTEQLNTALYERMCEEQKRYREWLLGLPTSEALDHAYEYVMREDILCYLEYHDLDDGQAAALLRSPSPLADIYKDFEKRETSHMEDIRDTIESRANAIISSNYRKKDCR